VACAWCVFSVGAAVNLWTSASFSALYGLGHMATERIIRAVSLIIGLVLTLGLLYAGTGIIGLAIASALQALMSRVIVSLVLYGKYNDLLTMHSDFNIRIAKKIMVPSLKWAVMGLGTIMIFQTDNVIIASVLGPAFIPSYDAATKIVITIMSFSLLIVSATSTQISKAFAEADNTLVFLLLSQSVKLSLAAVIFFVSFFGVFGDFVFDFWLGNGRFVGFPILWTLLLMVLLEAHHVSLAGATVATGHVVFALPALVAGLLNIFISLFLAHHLGLWGVALGTFIAQLLTNNWYAPYVALKHFRIPLTSHIKTILIPSLVMLSILLIANYFLRKALTLMNYQGFGMLFSAFLLSALIASVILL
jgi:O-antigen/teichoic acid export membrane protein